MKSLIVLLALISFSAIALTTGEKAPDFTLKGLSPKADDVALSDFKGKTIILEWLNYGCPFVRKHYDSGNMQALQKKYTDKDTVWFSIISSAKGKQGYVSKTEAIKEKRENNSHATDVLLDPTGFVGQLYGAKSTPHIYIIDKSGNLVYQGAIDDSPDTDKKSIASAKNYIETSLKELNAEKKVKIHTTKAYGCSIKY